MADDRHGKEQGLRVHYLANLGGLVALAGLDLEPPDFLLGALAQHCARGGVLTRRRASGNRSAGTDEAGRAGDGEAGVDLVEPGASSSMD